jgi:hypothetical protein
METVAWLFLVSVTCMFRACLEERCCCVFPASHNNGNRFTEEYNTHVMNQLGRPAAAAAAIEEHENVAALQSRRAACKKSLEARMKCPGHAARVCACMLS